MEKIDTTGIFWFSLCGDIIIVGSTVYMVIIFNKIKWLILILIFKILFHEQNYIEIGESTNIST